MTREPNKVDKLLSQIESTKSAIASLQGQINAHQNALDELQTQYADWMREPENSPVAKHIAANYARFGNN
jgi:septal ring factor EnvC (AmiA/AmiB activator)